MNKIEKKFREEFSDYDISISADDWEPFMDEAGVEILNWCKKEIKENIKMFISSHLIPEFQSRIVDMGIRDEFFRSKDCIVDEAEKEFLKELDEGERVE